MKKVILSLSVILLFSTQALSHSGRTDKDGGHNCSQKSIDKGLCTGYHTHNNITYANNAKGHEHHTHSVQIIESEKTLKIEKKAES